MIKKRLPLLAGLTILLFAFFFGCEEKTGEKEYKRALDSWESGQLSRAQGQMDKAIRKLTDPEQKSVANNQLGLILWQLGKTGEAVEKFAESCRLNENTTEANLNYAIALYKNNQLESANLEFSTLIGEQPTNPIPYLFSGLVHIKQGKWSAAQSRLLKGLQLQPQNLALQNAYALVELHKGGTHKALSRLKNIIASYPNYAPAFYNIAAIYDFRLHNQPLAIEWYKKYLHEAGMHGAQSLRTQEALTRLTRSHVYTARSGGSSAAVATLIRKGEQFHKSKKYAKAIEQYKKAMRLDPNNIKVHYDSGLAYYSYKKYASAERAFIRTLQLNPRNANARYMLVLAYAKQRKYNDAQREAKALKQLDPVRGKQMLKYVAERRRR
jgi:tetratricopeptide (TPR) repeat protein